MLRLLTWLLLLLLLTPAVSGQPDANYDENRVPAYTLPDPLMFPGGRRVKTAKTWERKRRAQILGLFEDQVYGKIPPGVKITGLRVREESEITPFSNGRRRQLELLLARDGRELALQVLLYLPKGVEKAPLFLGLNFYGNHTVTTDPAVFISTSWSRNDPSIGIVNHQLTEQSRGAESERWPVQMILDAGFGVATLFYGDVDPDRDDFGDGVHPFAYREGQVQPGPGEWGSLAAWAWGLIQVMDCLEKEPGVDGSRVILTGHSRLGKAALWAGALDQRFAAVISNNSGCGGAALFRRQFGETAERINDAFPHWFCNNFKAYNNREETLPVDQHQLLALIAPRPLYVASALEDQWADPHGEYLATWHAAPVYALYGQAGLPSPAMPPPGEPLMPVTGYHIRKGPHDITPWDWQQFIRFATRHLPPR
ncbi:MAG: hypothetical protein KA780_00135 [Prolixibacteraceae bacterium]|jgi:hypothetical protein|nr:hypothetical protein [Prolixibacteraceae bacterium]NLX27991.1 acetylxylan esterase [Bacteroidales bacterium]HNQ36522.1 hypothetical protein [Prolixibacteraceae bacterium]